MSYNEKYTFMYNKNIYLLLYVVSYNMTYIFMYN